MLILARRNLFSERTRLIIATGGIALSVLLITFLLALFRGWSEKVGEFVEDVNVDAWVAQEGTTDFLTVASILQTNVIEERLAETPCLERWSPLIARPMEATKGDTRMDVQLVGFDPQSGLGGPTHIEEGAGAPGPGEMIVDEALRRRYSVDIGDVVEAGGDTFTVVGLSSGGDFVSRQTVFVSFAQAQLTLEMEGLATFFLLRANPGGADALLFDAPPGVVTISSDDFVAETRDRVLGNVIPILTVVLVLAFIVGLAVSGLTIYTATAEKAREYGVLKALGFNNRYLYRLVMEQSVVTALLGFIVGAGATVVVGPFMPDLVPQFVTYVRWQDVLAVAGVTLLMSMLATYVPVRKIAAIDPVEVFKA